MPGPQIGTCSICRDVVEQSLQSSGIFAYSKAVRKGGKTLITINITGGPRTWPKNSLAAACWNRLSLDFHYHNAVRRGDMICCSGF